MLINKVKVATSYRLGSCHVMPWKATSLQVNRCNIYSCLLADYSSVFRAFYNFRTVLFFADCNRVFISLSQLSTSTCHLIFLIDCINNKITFCGTCYLSHCYTLRCYVTTSVTSKRLANRSVIAKIMRGEGMVDFDPNERVLTFGVLVYGVKFHQN